MTLIANALHDVEDKRCFFEVVRRISKPRALVVDVDWRRNVQLRDGPSAYIRLSNEQSMKLLSDAGFSIKRSIHAGPYHNGILCEKISEVEEVVGAGHRSTRTQWPAETR